MTHSTAPKGITPADQERIGATLAALMLAQRKDNK